jgi:hypothetical protein
MAREVRRHAFIPHQARLRSPRTDEAASVPPRSNLTRLEETYPTALRSEMKAGQVCRDAASPRLDQC